MVQFVTPCLPYTLLYPQGLTTLLVAASQDRLNLFPPEGLSGLSNGLATLGHQPPTEYLDKKGTDGRYTGGISWVGAV